MMVLISTFLNLLMFAILGRVIMDWLVVAGIVTYNSPLRPIRETLVRITEPVLAPIRRYARIGAIDLSPMIAIILISLLSGVMNS